MSNQILTQTSRQAPPATIVEIDLVRDGGHIFYNRRINDRPSVTAQRITREHARQIYEANANEIDRRTMGTVDFGQESCTWSWTVKLVEIMAVAL